MDTSTEESGERGRPTIVVERRWAVSAGLAAIALLAALIVAVSVALDRGADGRDGFPAGPGSAAGMTPPSGAPAPGLGAAAQAPGQEAFPGSGATQAPPPGSEMPAPGASEGSSEGSEDPLTPESLRDPEGSANRAAPAG